MNDDHVPSPPPGSEIYFFFFGSQDFSALGVKTGGAPSPPISPPVVNCRWIRRNLLFPSHLFPPFSCLFLPFPRSLLPPCSLPFLPVPSVPCDLFYASCCPSVSRFSSSAIFPRPPFLRSSLRAALAPRPPRPPPPPLFPCRPGEGGRMSPRGGIYGA
jgi:hypothetical protein